MVTAICLSYAMAAAPAAQDEPVPLQRPRNVAPPVGGPADETRGDQPSPPPTADGPDRAHEATDPSEGEADLKSKPPTEVGAPAHSTHQASVAKPLPLTHPAHGFSYEPSAGYSTGFMGPAINPSAHFGLFLGGSLPRRAGPRGGRQVALGALVHAEFPVLLHRHQLAVMGLAGQRNRLYWRLSGGVTGHYEAVGGGGGAALGFALPIPATRTMAMTLALTLFVDWASAANVAPGVHLSVVQF